MASKRKKSNLPDSFKENQQKMKAGELGSKKNKRAPKKASRKTK